MGIEVSDAVWEGVRRKYWTDHCRAVVLPPREGGILIESFKAPESSSFM